MAFGIELPLHCKMVAQESTIKHFPYQFIQGSGSIDSMGRTAIYSLHTLLAIHNNPPLYALQHLILPPLSLHNSLNIFNLSCLLYTSPSPRD